MSFKKRIFASIILVIAIVGAAISIYYFNMNRPEVWPQNNTQKKVVILGFDRVEGTLLDKWVREGKLPNIARLINTGTYSPLQTTTPAQSPVAWSSFATGTNPGKHDVMDFVIRDPKTYTPTLGIESAKQNKFGKPTITSTQKGETFWDILSKNGIKSKIIQVPVSFPAKPLNGKLLTGLGTPDTMGTFGTFGYYTTSNTGFLDNDMSYSLYGLENTENIITSIKGPKEYTEKLVIKRKGNSVDLTISGKTTNLEVGKWTDYIDVDFDLLGPLYKEHGKAKFYLEESSPELKLYLSPISFDPGKPFYDISYPSDYAKTLAEENGMFKTLGLSVDVWALKEERISDEVFLQDLNSTLDEEIRIMKSEMSKDDWNVYVQVFQATDLVQHMFWRYLDPSSPRYEENSKYQNAILSVYEKMDQVIGDAEKLSPTDTTFMVISDHGFSSYNKSVDINSWLVDNGYMTLKDPSKRSDWISDMRKEGLWDNVDWSKTKAYAIGLGSVYINLEGREGQGIVKDSDYPTLRNEIQSGLLDLKDGETNVISNIYKREDVMNGEYLGDAPDLMAGFAKGYRVSWQTTFGSVPKQIIFPNNSKYSGDHVSVDSKLVPGIFISNSKFGENDKNIMDIAPTVLDLFNIAKPANIDGKILSLN